MATDDPEDEIGEAVTRSNPRREGESDSAWKSRLSGIKSRAVKRFWNDLREIMDESGADTDGARKLYRDALKSLDAERSEVSRSEIIRIVAESIEEKEPTAKPAEEKAIWTGNEYTFQLQENAEQEINPKLAPGYHDYEATLFVYKRGHLLASEAVVFGASPSEWWYNFHEAARDFLRDTLGKDESPKGITFHVTEIRLVA